MFTGIIETTGTVISIKPRGRDIEYKVSCGFSQELKHGDSVSINGACQTVISKTNNDFSFFTSKETLSVTTFKTLKKGDKVNLERALKINGRLDGHIVSGHIDGTAKIVSIKKGDNSFLFSFEVSDKDLSKYIAKKGSIAIDGISLTVYDIRESVFNAAVIPLTIDMTTLNGKKTGDMVNIEVDIIAKYLERLIDKESGDKSGITLDFLKNHGFS